ncbi:MAG: SPOR domain-containing protein [Sulfurovaceae bacterium]|nr:SPOR domain-containing protein [Sulfurovaceae bacterium]
MKTNDTTAIGLYILIIFILNGCVTKTVNTTTPFLNKNMPIQNANERENKKIELPISTQVCVGDKCKVTIKNPQNNIIVRNKFKKEPKYEPFVETVYREESSENLSEDISNDNPYISLSVTDNYPQIKQHSNKISIQVGAFRRYKGAKIYARRYSLLSNQYKTIIKKDMKNNKPIYRVRIEGFPNKHKAKFFISRYSLNGAFLVRR